MHTRLYVSSKIALYSNDLERVLIMRYPKTGRNGLPGGHVEKEEKPDDTLRRELIEELDLRVDDLKRTDFFLREGEYGPIILAYVAIAPADVAVNPTVPSKEFGEWVAKDAIEPMLNMSAEYKRFILENWPNKKV